MSSSWHTVNIYIYKNWLCIDWNLQNFLKHWKSTAGMNRLKILTMHLAHISSLHFKWSLLRAGGGGRGATDSGSSWATARQFDSCKSFFFLRRPRFSFTSCFLLRLSCLRWPQADRLHLGMPLCRCSPLGN